MESEYCEGEHQENGDPGCDHDGLGGVDETDLHKHHNPVYLLFTVLSHALTTPKETLSHTVKSSSRM